MIKLNEVVVVEGRYDKIKLSSIIDAIIIETDGFGIFKNKEKQKLLRRFSQTKGIIVLTDSDSAGFKIRAFLGNVIPKDRIINVYVPDIYGKEKRKEAPSKEGKLGVEGIPVEVIEESLRKAGVGFEKNTDTETRKITLNDFYDDGLTGGTDSKAKRKQLLKTLDLPERMSTKSMIDILNSFVTFEEYKEAVAQCE